MGEVPEWEMLPQGGSPLMGEAPQGAAGLAFLILDYLVKYSAIELINSSTNPERLPK